MFSVSYICLIYKSTKWLKFTYEQFLKHTKMNEDDEFFFIANDAIPEVIEYLKDNNIKHYIHENSNEQKKEWYINNVYRAYNAGAKKAKNDYIIFLNSDFAYSPNWNIPLIENINPNICIASRLVERGYLKSGMYGIEKNFGDNYNNYDEENFLKYVNNIKENSLKEGGLFMPLLINKSKFELVNYYPEGNVKLINNKIILSSNPPIAKKGEQLIPGDLYLMHKLANIGVKHITSFNSIIYHFQQGEILDKDTEQITNKINSKLLDLKSIKKGILVNDYLFGLMGEKVLWDFMLESIPNLFPVDKKIIATDNIINSINCSFEEKVKLYINKHHNDFEYIIQNGTWFNLIDLNKPIIIIIQDNIRKMNRINLIQEENFKKADYVIINSNEIQQYYSNRETFKIPLGVNDELFKPIDNNLLLKFKKQINIPYEKYNKIGIFVGACNEIKGWNRIQNIINNNEDIFWIIVSKHTENIKLNNIIFFSKINQQDLSILYNIADFFIIGSPNESQCLAAIESCFCNTPIIMRNTGFVTDLNTEEQKQIGIISDDLEKSVIQMKNLNKNNFKPRDIVYNHFSISKMNSRWIKFINENIK